MQNYNISIFERYLEFVNFDMFCINRHHDLCNATVTVLCVCMSQCCTVVLMCCLEHQMGLFTVQSLAQLFQRCLMKVLHIDLWKCYLSYVRETKGKLPSYKYVR